MTPLELVEGQLKAYNERNLEEFCSMFSSDIVAYSLSEEKMLFRGMDKFKETYRSLFADSPNLHCKILSRVVMNNFVVDEEEVSGRRGMTVRAVAVYKITQDKISHVWFAI